MVNSSIKLVGIRTAPGLMMKKSTPVIVTNGGISTNDISGDISHPKI